MYAHQMASTLSHQLADRLARAELDRPAGERGDVFLEGVEAEGSENCRVDVLDRRGPGGILGPLGIGRSNHMAAAQAAAGKGQAEAGGPVVSASERIDLRRSAEFAAAEDDCPVEQLVPRQVCEAGRRMPGRAAVRVCGGSRGY